MLYKYNICKMYDKIYCITSLHASSNFYNILKYKLVFSKILNMFINIINTFINTNN